MDDEHRRALQAEVAKSMAILWVRNTDLENVHAGVVPATRTRDYTDVTIIDAEGRRIPWPEVSHFDEDAMRHPMRKVADRPFTLQELRVCERSAKADHLDGRHGLESQRL